MTLIGSVSGRTDRLWRRVRGGGPPRTLRLRGRFRPQRRDLLRGVR